MNVVVLRSLDDIAESIRSHWAATDEDRFAIGRDLIEARGRFVGDTEFGQWLKVQAFPFTPRWAFTLRLAAENESAVRQALGSQLPSGKKPNFEKAVKAALGLTKESKKKEMPIGTVTLSLRASNGLTLQKEAELFVRLQRERRALSAWDLYRAELAGGDEQTLAMQAAVHKAGFRIDQSTKGDPRVITAIDSVRFVYKCGGAALITDTLKLVSDSMWLNLDRSLSGPILKGIAIFLQSEAQRPNYDAERTVKVLRRYAPTFVMLKAQEIAIARKSASVSATNIAQAILDIYNDRLGAATKLPPITIGNRKRPAPKSK